MGKMICSKCGGDKFRKNGISKKGSQRYVCVSRLKDDRVCNSECKPIIIEDKPLIVGNKRVLVIPDTHFPFAKKGYLEFVKSVYDEYECDTVVHLGDLLDNHYSSFHDTDPDGMSASVEFEKSLQYVNDLAKVFPRMKICYGNHCRIPARKAFAAGVSNSWVKTIKDVLIENGCNISGWVFSDSFLIDNVLYVHGEGRQTKQRMMQETTSVVCGHYHTKSSVDWLYNDRVRLFAMQLGALIEDSEYAFAYAKNFAKSFKNCGVVIKGKIPIIIPMEL